MTIHQYLTAPRRSQHTLSHWKQGLALVCIALTTAFTTGCPPKKQVVAKCTDTAASVDFGPSRVGTTSIGILNTHHFTPGNVVELIPPTSGQTLGTGSQIDSLRYAQTDFLADDPPTTTSQVIATDFDLTVDAALKAFTATIKAELKQNTELTLTSGSRHSLAHPLDLVGNSANASISNHILQHPDRLYVLVTGVVNATDLSLQYQTKDSTSGSVNVLKIPGTKFSVDVTYDCSNVTELKAAGSTPAGVAFFYTTLAVVNGRVDTVTTADLTKYSLANAIE